MRFRRGADGPVACGHDTNIIYHNRETLAILQISECPDVMPRIKCCQVVGGGGLRAKQTKQGSFQNDSLLKLNSFNSDVFAAWDQVVLDSITLQIHRRETQEA